MAGGTWNAIVVAVNVLVAYASKRGSTKEIAEAVAKALRGAGLEADCLSTDEVESLEPHMPFWVFSAGPVGDPAKEDPSWLEPAKIAKKIEHLGVRDHVVFGGRVPAEPHGPIEKAMVENTPPEYRDRRDWGEIHAWAIGIASELKSPLCSAA